MILDRRRQRALCRRRLRQPPGDRLRRHDRRLQAPLGRVRQEARRLAISRAPASSCRAPSAARCSTRTARASTIPTGPPPPQFRIVHAVRISNDGLVYVCDRTNDRIQVFQQGRHLRARRRSSPRSTLRQRLGVGHRLFNRPGADVSSSSPTAPISRSRILRRETLEVVSAFGRAGHWAGQFYGAHNLAVDSKGNLYITETYEGKRVQKFIYRGHGTRLDAVDSMKGESRCALDSGRSRFCSSWRWRRSPCRPAAQRPPLQEKGGQEEFGPYEPVPNWPLPLPDGPDGVTHDGWTWGSVGAVFAETPDRIWIAQRGELPLPKAPSPGPRTRCSALTRQRHRQRRWPGRDVRADRRNAAGSAAITT